MAENNTKDVNNMLCNVYIENTDEFANEHKWIIARKENNRFIYVSACNDKDFAEAQAAAIDGYVFANPDYNET